MADFTILPDNTLDQTFLPAMFLADDLQLDGEFSVDYEQMEKEKPPDEEAQADVTYRIDFTVCSLIMHARQTASSTETSASLRPLRALHL